MLHIFCADNKGPAYHERSQSELEANAAAIVAAMNSLPALLECAEAVQGVAELLGEYIDRKQTVDVKVALAFETARAALDALSKDTP